MKHYFSNHYFELELVKDKPISFGLFRCFASRDDKHIRRAFTLVELLVVIAIIGLLSTVAIVSLESSRSKARYVRVLGDMEQIAKAAELYYNDSGAYPANGNMGVLPGEMSPYLSRWPVPPCSGWNYDWDVWTSGETVQITLRKADTTAVLYYGIVCEPGAVQPCNPSSGEIISYAAKTITCNE